MTYKASRSVLHQWEMERLQGFRRDPLLVGTRYAKWAGGSRLQTHRRAAMGGFTQDDGYVRGVAPTHDCSSGSLLHEQLIGQTKFSFITGLM
jgi:hypothetical protein